MMRGLLASVMVAAMAAAGCGDSPSAPGDVPYGEQFNLKIGESIRVGSDGVGVTFEAVKSDSRCPIDAICIQNGDAVAAVRFDLDGRTLRRDLNTERGTSEVVLDRYSVRVVSLQPYPRSDRPTPPAEYVAQLQLNRR